MDLEILKRVSVHLIKLCWAYNALTIRIMLASIILNTAICMEKEYIITASYSARLARHVYNLYIYMVELIGGACKQNGTIGDKETVAVEL